jgi:1-acyl-sn-glycerol-3-phosphate acyltransferase
MRKRPNSASVGTILQDIFSLFHLNRPFKFISKKSIFYIPIVGWSMFMTGHVMLNRMDRRSQLDCLKQCRELLEKVGVHARAVHPAWHAQPECHPCGCSVSSQGAPVLFFPEGTRSKDCVMKGFKKGAFSVAVKAGVDVVPITVLGTGKHEAREE